MNRKAYILQLSRLSLFKFGIFIFSLIISTTSFADLRSSHLTSNPTLECTRPYCDMIKTDQGQVEVHSIEHASFVLTYQNDINDSDHPLTIIVDPVDHIDTLITYRPVDIILVTDIHRDHFDPEALQSLMEADTTLIVPKSVANEDDFPAFFAGTIKILNNDDQYDVAGIHIKAMPMYNLDPQRNFHPRGRGNGYVLRIDNKQIYISGDTQAIPEMLALTDIDVAFVVMNLPFTMDVNEASRAVLTFKPTIVYPYHYRNGNGTFSDIQSFHDQVAANPNIAVPLLDWYPNHELPQN